MSLTIRKAAEVMAPDDWQVDLEALAGGLVERHRDPFHLVSRERFDATVAGLHDRIPELSGTGVLVGFDEVAAMIGDGHTRVATDEHYRRVPLELFWYGDQLRVTKADNRRVLGAQVVAIGGVAVEEIDRRLRSSFRRARTRGMSGRAVRIGSPAPTCWLPSAAWLTRVPASSASSGRTTGLSQSSCIPAAWRSAIVAITRARRPASDAPPR